MKEKIIISILLICSAALADNLTLTNTVDEPTTIIETTTEETTIATETSIIETTQEETEVTTESTEETSPYESEVLAMNIWFGIDIKGPQKKHITVQSGVFNGPSGRETFYNLPMKGVISHMRKLGYDAEEFPYWVRDDGCKMYGDYIMVATDTKRIPKGTIIETSLGLGIVCDHCESAAESNEIWLDIATIW